MVRLKNFVEVTVTAIIDTISKVLDQQIRRKNAILI